MLSKKKLHLTQSTLRYLAVSSKGELVTGKSMDLQQNLAETVYICGSGREWG